MKKTVAGVLVGTVVYFVWGAVSWTVLPWHNSTIKKLPEEQLIMDTLKTVIYQPGFYMFPCHMAAEGAEAQKTWEEKYKKGPNGIVIFTPNGRDPMPPTVFLYQILGDVVIAIITMLILTLSRDRVRSIVPRAFLVASCGLIVGVAAHLSYWNWFQFPCDLTVVAICDSFVSFLLLGFAQAKFVPEN